MNLFSHKKAQSGESSPHSIARRGLQQRGSRALCHSAAALLILLAACTPPKKSASKSESPAARRGVKAITVFPTELPLLAGAAPHRIVVTATDLDGFEVPAPCCRRL